MRRRKAVLVILAWALCMPALARGAERAISLAPSITETVFALGAQEQLIAVTRFCQHPPEAMKLPKLGGPYDINIESIALLRPSLVITLGEHGGVLQKLRAIGVKTISVQNESIEQIIQSIRTIGEALGRPKESKALIKRIRADISSARKAIPEEAPLATALVIVGRSSEEKAGAYFVSGRETIYDDVLRTLGVANAAGSLPGYPQVSLEAMHSLSLTHIFDISTEKQPINELKRHFPNVSVVQFSEDFMYAPGPRIAQIVAQFSNAIHGP